MQADQYDVTMPGGDVQRVTVDGRDYMFYERESGDSVLDLDMRRIETWYQVACAAMRRQGLWDGSPDEFYEQVAFVIPAQDGGQQADPTTRQEV